MRHVFLFFYLLAASTGSLVVFDPLVTNYQKSPADPPSDPHRVYESGNLSVDSLTPHTFVHISYLDIPNYGKFACNGLIFCHNGEAIVFDTPPDDAVSQELIRYVKEEKKCRIKAVVINHFHNDCLGGLRAFHEAGIPSYAYEKTVEFAERDSAEVPQYSMKTRWRLKAGGKSVINIFPGEGHTRDNIVSYIPAEKVLFGGCMIKEINAGKGNLKDANTMAWPETVRHVKEIFPEAVIIVPGHGTPGDRALLDYTIQLYSK